MIVTMVIQSYFPLSVWRKDFLYMLQNLDIFMKFLFVGTTGIVMQQV